MIRVFRSKGSIVRALGYCLAGALVCLLSGCDSQDSSLQTPEAQANRYQLLGADGQPLESGSADAHCAQDLFTGLIWEIKSDAAGLHDWRNTYSWYDPTEVVEPELDYRGTPSAGVCAGSACDTTSFAAAVNAAGYCGHSDWRTPSRDELASISILGKLESPPTINLDVFPFTQAEEYWSSNDYSFQWNAAWVWHFQFGHDRVDWKASPKKVRLVRGEAMGLKRVED